MQLQNIPNGRNPNSENTILFLICLLLVFITGCTSVGVFYGGPIGKGKGGNKFELEPGVQLAVEKIKTDGSGFRAGIAYQKVVNKVGTSTADGRIITPLYVDFIYPMWKAYKHGLHYSLGFNWNMMKLGDVEDYDQYGTGSVGFTYRFSQNKTNVSLIGKYHFFLIDHDTFKNLEQNGGVEIGIQYSFK